MFPVVVLVILGVWIYTGIERDPAFQMHMTTFDGKEAVGQLHRDGTYTFWYFHRSGNLVYAHHPIATFPAGEAAKLH